MEASLSARHIAFATQTVASFKIAGLKVAGLLACNLVLLNLLICQPLLADQPADGQPADGQLANDQSTPSQESEVDQFVSDIQQITFEGQRAGEGYFSTDGRQMVFQSERDPANPFYQIYLTDLETGDLRRVSPGYGKTTCAWIHPDGDRVLFAGTMDDPNARAKQTNELHIRAIGKQRRYAWDYDSHYELYDVDLATNQRRRLTNAKGYDAEASYSPDGSEIIFASNRAAFENEMSERDKAQFDIDPAFMNDIYIMNADGTNVRRLTHEPGYDGGPFFSADGTQICWRRFSIDGATAEIFTADRDGSNVRRLTNLGAMSWAPYFHPSGEYLIFTTNRHGFANFELYLVRADGKGEPIRVTGTDGFDGLPVFLADGEHLSWTSTRNERKKSQIYLADWDHDAALTALGIDATGHKTIDQTTTDPALTESGLTERELTQYDTEVARLAAAETGDQYSAPDLIRHVDYLTRKELGGRLTGSDGERKATAYVAAYLSSLGFLPAGENGTYFQRFDFPAGSEILPATSMSVGGRELDLNVDYRPMVFSGDGTFDASEVVFAGYGMQIPPTEIAEDISVLAKETAGGGDVDDNQTTNDDESVPDSIQDLMGNGYDSYVHLNVQDRYVMVLRDMPQDVEPEMRQRMARYSSPRRKAAIARDLGAKGILFVAGPTSGVRHELIRFDNAASGAKISMAAVSITNRVAQQILDGSGKNLGSLQKTVDDGSMAMGFLVENVDVSATIAVQRNTAVGRNVIARLPAGNDDSPVQFPVIMVGAHIDHLGRGGGGNSLAREDEEQQIHFGADDNASGVAAMLEIAQYLASSKRRGSLSMKRDLLIGAWSGEELGLFGSQAFIENFTRLFPEAPIPETDPDSEEALVAAAHGMSTDAPPLSDGVGAYFNLDMVGRMEDNLIIQGIGSSPGFEAEVRRRNVPVRLSLSLDKKAMGLPTDASAFVSREVPILSAFTGAHEDYHTPRDTADKLNYNAMVKIAKLGGLVVRGWLTDPTTPIFKLDVDSSNGEEPARTRLTAFLGTIPDYAASEVKGLKLSGVAKNGPADQAGVAGGDIVLKLAGRKIEGIYDYTYAIEALKIGQEVEIVVLRGDKTVPMRIIPASRE